MRDKITFFQSWRWYLIGTLVFMVIGGLIVLTQDKAGTHLYFNRTHSDFQDFVFRWLTHGGDGYFAAFGAVLLVFITPKDRRLSIFLTSLIALLVCGGLTLFLKQVVFHDALRPSMFLANESLHCVAGVDLHGFHSFPSGHTSAAFAFYGLWAIAFGKRAGLQGLFLLLAILVGYSRIYLSQHFLEDVVVGAGVGILCLSIGYAVGRRFDPHH